MDNGEPNYYNYKAKTNMSLYLNHEIENYTNVHICAYNITNDGKYPFLSFLLSKNDKNDILTFPLIPIFKKFNTEELINYTKVCLFGLLMLLDFETFNDSIEFNGFLENNNNLYLFFDITNCKLKISDIYRTNNVWFALIDEIVNQKYMCNMTIDNNVTELFINNEKFCFVVDENENSYEIPIVSYVGKPENKLNFTYVFGELANNKNGILGPYCYFTNYYNAFKSENADGIVRFAIFTGVVKYIENSLDDPIDKSDIKQQRLIDPSLDQNMERLTMRISDHDGKWAKQFDSAYLGPIELDNGTQMPNTPVLAIKEHDQAIPLSYHYIDKQTLKNRYEDYFIQ